MTIEPLTRAEVLAWPALGPMTLNPARVLALLDERDNLRLELEKTARESTHRLNLMTKAESERDEARAHPSAGLLEDLRKVREMLQRPKNQHSNREAAISLLARCILEQETKKP